jgi:hypothetical protein
MDLASLHSLHAMERQVVRHNIGYLIGEELMRGIKEFPGAHPEVAAFEQNDRIGYEVMSSLETPLFMQNYRSKLDDLKKLRKRLLQGKLERKLSREKVVEVSPRPDQFPEDQKLEEEIILEDLEAKQQEELEMKLESREKAPILEEELLNRFFPAKGSPVENLIIAPDQESYDDLLPLFQLIPEEILVKCVSLGARLYVIKNGKIYVDLKELSIENLQLPGAYAPLLRAGYMHKEALKMPTMENLPLILFGHIYDHALGGDTFASLKSPAVFSLYLACKQRRQGHQFMSGYSEAGPVQYFAQSMASYFYPYSVNKLFTRKVLKLLDHAMYEYMSCLFGSISG